MMSTSDTTAANRTANPSQLRQPESNVQSRKGIWITLAAFALISLFSALLYVEIVSYRTFGPEYAMFYEVNSTLSLAGVWHWYTMFNGVWYRPTAFVLPYWVGQWF